MASRMKIWLGVVLGGILLIGVWGIPPKSYEDWRGHRWGDNRLWVPERVAFNQVRGEVSRKNWLYQRLQWTDSMAYLARTSRESGWLWMAVLPDSAPSNFLPGLEAAVAAQLAGDGIGEPRIPVGVALMDARTGAYPPLSGGDYGYSLEMEVHLGREPESPFCYLLTPVYGMGPNLERSWNRMVWAPADSSAPPRPLGPCALHAKYGTPGPELLQWLAGRGYAMAVGQPRTDRVLDSWEWEGRALPALGRRTLWYGGAPEAEACLAGKVEGCWAALFQEGASGEWIGRRQMALVMDSKRLVAPISPHGWNMPFGGRESGLLWDLEAEFGPERFQAFWSSNLGVEEAFQLAFGSSFPDWVMKWAQDRFGVSKVGAVVPVQATFLSFLTIFVMAGVALILGRRRG